MQTIPPIRGLCPEYIKTDTIQQQKETNYPIKKMGKGPELTLLLKRHIKGQEIYEKMLNFTSCKGNANQNQTGIQSHTGWNGYYKQDK